MTNSVTSQLRFNALTDEWLPLLQKDGSTQWASPVEVLCGEKDGVDLDYPRDDFRVYGRLLLSALVQALFPAKTKTELIERLDKPLNRTDVVARIEMVVRDFDLFGPRPFLQITPATQPKEKGAAPFVFPLEDMFPSRVPIDAVSLPIALVMLFIEQTYAGGAGRGHKAGPGGQPGAFTLIDPGSVRAGAWANTLSLERVQGLYAADKETPWSNEKQVARPRASIGIVGGLFFQPRAMWLVDAGEGICSFTGREGPRVRRSRFLRKSELARKASGAEDLWQHPCSPLAVNSQGIGPIRLNVTRPIWIGLAQLLRPLSPKAKINHPREGPAPALEQWKSMPTKTRRPRLLVLDFDRDKANVKGRFFEGFPLTDHLLENTEVVERLRALTEDAQDVEDALTRALLGAHDDRRQGGFALADAQAAFWRSSERPFFDWLAIVTAIDAGREMDDEQAEAARRRMESALRSTARSIFDEHVALSEFDPRKQARVAKARRDLAKALYSQRKTTTSN